ncbi:mannopine transport system ATP-binding protein [Methylobacterium sp. 174MFSha1.1]|uniref:ABC transporter ATP-binding protein n=1 Tax=Methylobacterium sp. 174MFSha1.1 TaxID=1502749 RepID=UPI0008E65420|nr:ABC transporter ATP-binding protein [Methylobacterium sp. 174MFSha1.1]SFU50056.1 mannopine transport system ATP-binding protein [Methylobacterium sp. 174MFSha1.1]
MRAVGAITGEPRATESARTGATKGAAISVRGLTRRFGSVTAVDAVSLEIAAGEFVALLGPSGSGKSTVLMSLAGFDLPDEGTILIGGEDCTRLPPHRRNIGMVFQHYTLFPHLSVADNVAFPLKMRGIGRAERRARAEAALDVVRLSGFGTRMPRQLSGGQQQRVALARAIVYQPRVLLMDEPLSALDKNLREEMQIEIKRLHSELGITIVFVTHDQGEALTMADRVAILRQGRVQQIAPARTLYERPANLFAAGFIGDMNRIAVAWDGRAARIAGQAVPLGPDAAITAVPPGPAILAVRPERIEIAAPDRAGALPATVTDIVYGGAGTLVIATLQDGAPVRARAPSAGLPPLEPGARIGLVVPAGAALLYPAEEP